jgi:hypothetical protein
VGLWIGGAQVAGLGFRQALVGFSSVLPGGWWARTVWFMCAGHKDFPIFTQSPKGLLDQDMLPCLVSSTFDWSN